ncbi:MAG TPA: acyl-CoA dehydrogenase family protein [Acidimicrobiales bacterium]|nr:acyl-CoA dehydrogenase family protein [Acidimicrobiales bacterium]
MTTIERRSEALTAEMLERFDERAPRYDRENRFLQEDFDELRASGYLDIALPEELGGAGRSLMEVNRLQRRLAYHAPATALAVNMHVYWVGMAADLERLGAPGGAWILQKAAEGEVLAAGHGEAGNDVPVLMSSARADRVDGGWEITAHKIFGSLSPVWTYLGVHALDTSDPSGPRVVHGFLDRRADRYHIEETWDVLGMRATASHDTILERAFVPDENVAMVCPAGFAGAGPFHVALFAWALLGFAGVFLALAQRAFDEVVSKLPDRTSVALTRSMAHHPEVQHAVAEMRIALEAAEAHLDRVCDDWSSGVQHGDLWPLKILACKHHVVSQAWSAVDTALDVSGGAGIFKRTRLEQLVRDARLGRIHPGNAMLTHEVVGKLSLGIDPDEQPRWG